MLKKINQRYAPYLIFLLSFFVQLLILLLENREEFKGDEFSYHNIAVNLVKGNGYSNCTQAPFEKWYFREPGYPYFIAGVYSIANLITPIDYSNTKLNHIRLEVVFLKIFQMFLLSTSILIFFFIFKNLIDFRISLITTIIISISFTVLFFSTFILRESLVFFLLTLLNYFQIKYFQLQRKQLYLIISAVLSSLLILVFQVHFVIVFFWILFTFLYFKDFRLLLKHSLLYCFVIIILLIPHLYNVYSFYPDIKICKTFGSSFTYELNNYTGTIIKLEKKGILSKDDAQSFYKEWQRPSKIQFQKSFDGTYNRIADSLSSQLNQGFSLKNLISKLFTVVRKSFFQTRFTTTGDDFIEKNGIVLYLLFIFIPPFLIGILGIIGSIFYLKKYYKFLLPYILYLSMIYFLGSEYRRMIILYPYLVFFAVLFVLNKSDFILKKFKYTLTNRDKLCKQ